MTCEKYLESVKARAAVAPSPPLFDWNEDSLRVAYLNGGLAHATYEMQCRYVGPNHPEVGTRLIEDAIRVAIRTDVPRLIKMVECARERLGTLLRACEMCEGLNDTGSLRAKATKAHIEDTFAELDRIASEER